MDWIKIVYLENYPKDKPKLFCKDGNVCFDVRAAIDKRVLLWPGRILKVPLGIKIELPNDCGLSIRPRSGLGSRGLTVVNSPSTIDPSYRGQVYAPMINLSREKIYIDPGDRIAQANLEKIIRFVFKEISEDQLSETWRGENGFGHTGVI